MKAVIVTSRVTYIPHNYALLFEEVIKNNGHQLAGIVLLNNYDRSLLKGILGTAVLGAYRLCGQLLLNTLSSIFTFLDRRVQLAKANSIPLLRYPSANHPDFIHWVKEQGIDVVINARTRCIYKQEILNAPTYGCFNIHHGLLPDYRGTMCDLYALFEDRPAGFSIHKMSKKIDDGEIYQVVEVSKGIKDYLHHQIRSSVIEGQKLSDLLDDLSRNKGSVPTTSNKSDKKIYTKNPLPSVVREMKRKGMKL